jgi:PUA domain protein
MFKKFDKNEISSIVLVKSSVGKKIVETIKEEYPLIEDVIEELFPKKSSILIAKCHNRVTLIIVNKHPLFFQEYDGPFYPHLKLLHKCKKIILFFIDPFILPHMTVDRVK